MNSVKSSADFVPFGGWLVAGNKVLVKTVAEDISLGYTCGFGFIDMIYNPISKFL
jgi:hypothetical protein